MNYKNNILLLQFLIILSLVFSSCKNQDDNADVQDSRTPVQVTNPQITNMTDYLQLNANTVFLNKEIVRATFQGFIEKTYKNIGDAVKPGDVLFQIRTKELASDTLSLKIGSSTFKGSVNIKAKSAGILTELDYHTGDFISDGEQIAIVSNPASLMVKLNVPFEDVAKINSNGSCIVGLPGGEKVPGIISKRIPTVDPGTQTQIYLIKLLSGKEIPENLNVNVKIPVKVYKDAVSLPKSTVMSDETESSFWVMKLINDSTAIRTDIKKGIESDSLIQILDPKLNAADRIISNGAYGLPDTAKIEIAK